MNRRAFLRTASVGAAAVAGCLGASDTPADTSKPTDETTNRTTTRLTETTQQMSDECSESVVPTNRLHTHSDYGLGIVQESVESPAVAVVGEDWQSKLRTEAMSDDDEKFVTETNFDQSVLVVLQYTKSSSAEELRITGSSVEDGTFHLEVCVSGARGASPDDAPTTNLFARLDAPSELPTAASARIRTPNETVTVSSE